MTNERLRRGLAAGSTAERVAAELGVDPDVENSDR